MERILLITSDSDGYDDGAEVNLGTDPSDPNDYPFGGLG